MAERTERLEAVQVVTGEITRELDLTVLLQVITRRAVELVRGTSGVTYLWDELHPGPDPARLVWPGGLDGDRAGGDSEKA